MKIMMDNFHTGVGLLEALCALLKKARIGGIFANNCDCDVSNPQHTGYIKYHWTDIGCLNVHESVR